MKYATLLPSQRTLPINTIFCIGQNYADHAKEMGSTVPTTPVIFLKPSNAIVDNGGTIFLPAISQNVHHEVEMTVLIGKSGKDIPVPQAMDHVAGIGIGLDMTMRDIQAEAKKQGKPWSTAKGFYSSAPLSQFMEIGSLPTPLDVAISLRVNRELRQQGRTSQMIFSIPALISYISTVFGIEEGDVIYTGTPEGVAQVHHGDVLEATADGITTLRVNVQ